jgi:hypothetical protein
MSAWPTTLPSKALMDSFHETAPDLALRSGIESYVALVRRRTTSDLRPITLIFKMSTAQVAIFDSFYLTDCVKGSISFTYTDPRTKVSQSFRFTKVPEYSTMSHNLWQVALELEKLP